MKKYEVILYACMGVFFMVSSCNAFEFETNTFETNTFETIVYVPPSRQTGPCMLVGNIGGTQTRLGLVQLHNDGFRILVLLKTNSAKVKEFVPVLKEALEGIYYSYNVTITDACFAVAGVINQARDYCAITNLDWHLNVKEMIEKTSLESAVLLNDFEAIGYGIEGLSEDDFFVVNKGTAQEGRFNKVVLGAGTGLGKCILIWDEATQWYRVVSSEGGHIAFPAYDAFDFALAAFIKDEVGGVVEWEHLLSGKGIVRIYKFLRDHQGVVSPYAQAIEASGFDPQVIVRYKPTDPCCEQTLALFVKFYARCAKDAALDTLALRGVYLSGGITQDNMEVFSDDVFMREFCDSPKFGELLSKVPVSIICNKHVELHGAALFGRRFFTKFR